MISPQGVGIFRSVVETDVAVMRKICRRWGFGCRGTLRAGIGLVELTLLVVLTDRTFAIDGRGRAMNS